LADPFISDQHALYQHQGTPIPLRSDRLLFVPPWTITFLIWRSGIAV